MENTSSYISYLKSPYRSGKHSTYFHVYDNLFSKYRNKPITFVEIGVLGGGSLFMWRDFFGPRARIIGVDFNPAAKKWQDSGFEIYIGSQSDELFWRDFIKYIGNIDIVLDDGGHTYAQQIITTELLSNIVNDGGMIVVEDTHTSYMEGFGPKRFSFINYVKQKIDFINYRFSSLSNFNKTESRFWSIQIFESIVAFHVNTRAVKIQSQPTENHGKWDQAIDFRYKDNKYAEIYFKVISKLNLLKFLPFSKLIHLIFKEYIFNHKDAKLIKKYFDLG